MTAIVFLIATLSEVVEGAPSHENVFKFSSDTILFLYTTETLLNLFLVIFIYNIYRTKTASWFAKPDVIRFPIFSILYVQIYWAVFRLKVWGSLSNNHMARSLSKWNRRRLFKDCVTPQLDTRMLTWWYLTLLQK